MMRMKFKRIARKRYCKFCAEKSEFIDYKDIKMLRSYITERGKMLPSRMTGTCARHQRELTGAVRCARNIALLSFVEK
jgi:small subunit ribosomal protein S18